jgi:hypothetical protein
MPGLLPRWITLSDHRGLFLEFCRSLRIRYGAVKTLEVEWLRTGNRNLMGMRELSAREIARATIQVFKGRRQSQTTAFS